MAGQISEEFRLNLVGGAGINPLPLYWLRRTLLSRFIQPIRASARRRKLPNEFGCKLAEPSVEVGRALNSEFASMVQVTQISQSLIRWFLLWKRIHVTLSPHCYGHHFKTSAPPKNANLVNDVGRREASPVYKLLRQNARIAAMESSSVTWQSIEHSHAEPSSEERNLVCGFEETWLWKPHPVWINCGSPCPSDLLRVCVMMSQLGAILSMGSLLKLF